MRINNYRKRTSYSQIRSTLAVQDNLYGKIKSYISVTDATIFELVILRKLLEVGIKQLNSGEPQLPSMLNTQDVPTVSGNKLYPNLDVAV
jgi:hypothetical protein